MGWFKKLAKKAAKGLGKIALAAAKTTPVGKIIVPAASKVIKSLATTRSNAHASSLKLEPVSVRAQIVKSRIQPAARLDAGSLGDATTMPGGAPLRSSSKRRKASPAPKRRASKAKVSTGKRSAPKGGLDLARIGAAWRAGGKNSGVTYSQWVKDHSSWRK